MARKDKKKSEKSDEDLYSEPSYDEPKYEEPRSSYSSTREEPSESRIELRGGSEEGLLAIVKIAEDVKVEQDHDANLNSLNFSGQLIIENPSNEDRLWDIDVVLKDKDLTNLESDQIIIKELGIEEEDKTYSIDFEIAGDAQNNLLVKEYINTMENADEILNIRDIETHITGIKEKSGDQTADDSDADEEETEREKLSLESFGISINKENRVYFVIALKSYFEKSISEIRAVKTVPPEFSEVQIIDSSVGLADLENDQIIWNIDELEPESTVFLKIAATIMVDSHDLVKTGKIELTFKAQSSFVGSFGIEKFDAYSRNKFYIDILEEDEAPGTWDCQLVFENTSEFMIELFNADVYAADDESQKFVEIDTENVPQLPAGAKWFSAPWKYESEEMPSFRRKLEFRVLPEFQTDVNTTITISDVELGLASVFGEVAYDVAEIELPIEQEEGIKYVPTYKETDINSVIKVKNDGSAPLNDLTVKQQYFSEEFQPPSSEEITILKNGKKIKVLPEDIRVEDNTLIYEVKNLKDRDVGMLDPSAVIELQYPIHAINPKKDTKFESDIIILANTYPRGTELEYSPEPADVPVIEAIHIRRKYEVDKEMDPIGDLGEYEIVLHVRNLGEYPLKDMVVRDALIKNFERSDFSMEPTISEIYGEQVLEWTIETIAPGEIFEISYKIKGTGDYHPSDGDLSF